MEEEEEGISEELVRSNLELFLPYICDCVKATDLLVHLPMFTREQRKEIFSLSTRNSQKATQLALKVIKDNKDDSGRYTALLDAIADTGYTKVAKILQGRHTPCDANCQKIVDLFTPELIARLRPIELLPMLHSYNVIGQSDSEEIRAEEMNYSNSRACWLMLYYLPCREKNWFKYFLLTLMRTKGHEDLAQKLDPDLYEKLLVQQREADSSSLASLQGESLSLIYARSPLFDVRENLLSDEVPGPVDERVGSAQDASTTAKRAGDKSGVPPSALPAITPGAPPSFPKGAPPGFPNGSPQGIPPIFLPGAPLGIPLGVPPGFPPGFQTGFPLGVPPGARGMEKVVERAQTQQDKHLLLKNLNISVGDDLMGADPIVKANTIQHENVKPALAKRLYERGTNPDQNDTDQGDKPVVQGRPAGARWLYERGSNQDQEVIEKDTIEDTKEFNNDFTEDFSSLTVIEDKAKVVVTTESSGTEPSGIQGTNKADIQSKMPSITATSDETSTKALYERQVTHANSPEAAVQAGETTDVSLLSFDELLSEPNSDNTKVKHRVEDPDETGLKTVYSRQRPRPEEDRGVASWTTGRRGSVSSGEEELDDDFEKLLLDDLKADKDHENDLSGDTDSSDDEEKELNIKTDEDTLEETEDRDIELRGYQRELARAGCEGENVIVMAPTNSGKTRVACAIIQAHMRHCRREGRVGRVIFIVENEALAGQQGTVCADQLPAYRTKVISGSIQRDKQQYLKDFVDRRDILVVTAQVLVNALTDEEISSVSVFSMIVFDECHHNDGGHPYNQIMIKYMDLKLNKNNQLPLPQIVGLTASVGVGGFIEREKALGHIKTILANLDTSYLCTVRENLEELRRIQNPPVEEIVVVQARDKDVFHETVCNCIQRIDRYISNHQCMANLDEDDEVIKAICRVPLLKSGSEQFIQWLSEFRKAIGFVKSDDAREVLNRCRHHLEVYNKALMVHRDARVKEACLLLHVYMGDQIEQNTRKDDTDRHLLNIYQSVQNIDVRAIPDSPKLLRLKQIILGILGNDPDARGIIFVKTRELARALTRWTKETTELAPLRASEFVGQVASATDGGMTKSGQKDILEYFRGGRHRLIIATSVAEEGLDIAKCNLVIRYEHVTSMIVRLQSRGRARAEDSRYYVVTQVGSQIAQREEKNRRLEELMQELVPVVQTEIEADQNAWQQEMRNIQKDLKAKRARQQIHDDEIYRIQCMNCPQFICWSFDIKQIQNAHHIVIDKTVKERIVTVRSPFPAFEESELKYDGGIFCQNCVYKLGGVCEYKQVEFPLLKIKCIRIVDNTDHGQSEKKWKKVPFTVEKFTLDDLKEVVDRKLAEEAEN